MEVLKQRVLEHIADLLDEPTFDMDMKLKGLIDPLPSDKSELHLLMTDAAFKALCTYFNKQDNTKQCAINGIGCYSNEEGREFNLLKRNKPPFNKLILIHTFDDEVLSVKAYDSVLGIEFRCEEENIFLEEHEVKGWSFC